MLNMARKPELELYSRAIGQDLPTLMKQMRADGLNPSQICNRLYKEHDIDVSDMTIRRWLARIDEMGVV